MADKAPRKTRAQAVAEDADARRWAAAQEPAWQDRNTVALALGLALPEKRPTAAEKRHIKKQAEKIIYRELLKLIDGVPVEFNMKGLLLTWIEQCERGRGRPRGAIKERLIIEAVSQEYRTAALEHRNMARKIQPILDEIGKLTGLKISPKMRRPLHKVIQGVVGDRAGVGRERMKQIAPSGVGRMRRLARDRKPDTE